MKISSIISTENIGVSGCKILYQDNKVIKTSGAASYDSRLIKQAQKQNYFFKNLNLPRIRTPYIFKVTENSFTMERIHGLSWLEYLKHASITDINKLTNTLIHYLKYLKSTAKSYNSHEFHTDVLAKLHSLYPKSNYKDFILFLSRKLLSDNTTIPRSFCHGDLIFFNMMFSGDNLYFIDFLDSYIDSYWVDLIKLRQDLKYYYCLRMNDIDSLRIKSIFEYINNKIAAEFKKELSNFTFHILEAISILRIEPYVSLDKKEIIDRMLQGTVLYKNFQ